MTEQETSTTPEAFKGRLQVVPAPQTERHHCIVFGCYYLLFFTFTFLGSFVYPSYLIGSLVTFILAVIHMILRNRRLQRQKVAQLSSNSAMVMVGDPTSDIESDGVHREEISDDVIRLPALLPPQLQKPKQNATSSVFEWSFTSYVNPSNGANEEGSIVKRHKYDF